MKINEKNSSRKTVDSPHIPQLQGNRRVWYRHTMKIKALFCCAIAFVTITAWADFQSPRDLATRLEEKLARFEGLWLPSTNFVFTFDFGVRPLPEASTEGFPQSFMQNLVPVEEFGIETFPFSFRVEDDETGITVFRNANQGFVWEEFPTVDPYQSDWIVQLFGREPSTLSTLTLELLRPSHVGVRAIFVAEEDIQAYNEARLSAPPPPSAAPWPTDIPVVNFTRIDVLTNAIAFASEWNDVAYFPPPSRMNLFWKPRLDSPAWTVIHTVPVSTSQRRAVFDVPWTMIPPEPFVHDPLCAPTEIYMPSPLDPDMMIYTNVVCECVAPSREMPAGFFKLGIRDTGFLPAWWRILYGFAPYDSWEDYVDFNGSGYANWEKHEQDRLNNPVTPPSALNATGSSIIYLYDEDDRLDTTFVADEGDAAVRYLSPAGNPDIQQERSY